MSRILCRSVLILVFASVAAGLVASRLGARHTLNLPATPYRYASMDLPAHFAQAERNRDNTPADNPVSDDGATLGRVLFYDTRISANDTTSCASCHVQAHAFGDPRPFSIGFHGARTDRRAMPLVNIRYYERARFFWDERADNLEDMVLLPIQSRIEMGQDLKRVVETLARDRAYPELFARAFGDGRITDARIGKALAQFVRSIVSYRSRYDEGRARAPSARDDFDNFTVQENRGKALFMRNCSTCHMKDGNEHFFGPAPANTGLRGDDPAADGGVGDATLQAADLGSFKSPSLRNVEVTAPYGHDGRFATLGAVIDHYSDHAIFDPTLGYAVPFGPLKFTASEKAALSAFLKALTDPASLTDPRFSNPFVHSNAAQEWLERTTDSAGARVMAVGAAIAQAPAVLRSALIIGDMPPLPLAPRMKSHDPVIERLMSLDGNADRRVSRGELPERMQELLSRGDRNADHVLDRSEIDSLVNGASGRRRASLPAPPSEGLSGVIRDLKLPPAKHRVALALVSPNQATRRVNNPPDPELSRAMRALLDGEEYENFLAARARLPRTSPIVK